MLQKIRERISGWIAGVVIALVAGAFMLFGVEYYFEQGPGSQNEVAKVNGVIITEAQVNNAFSQLQQQTSAEMKGQPLTEAMTQELKSYALQSLVSQTALFTTLSRDHFNVSLMQAKLMIEETPQFQDKGKFSEAKLMEVLYQANLTPDAFFQRVQSQMVVNQVMEGVLATAFALPSEVNHWYALEHQQRAFGYFIIPMQSFMSKVAVTADEIKDNYTANQAVYETPAQVSVSYLLLSPTAIAKTVTVTSAEAKEYYESHLANYTGDKKGQSFAATKSKLMQLLQHQRVNEILTKQSSALSDLTYTNPDSLAVASKTLNLPIQTSPMMTKAGAPSGLFSNPKVIEAIFSDSVFKSGNNSDPITLKDGSLIVLRVLKKNPSQPIPLATVSAKIKQQLMQKQATAQAGLLAYQLQKKLAAGADAQTVAKQNGLQWHAVALTAQNKKSIVPSTILSNAFNMQKGVQAVLINTHDYAVIDVTAVKNADASKAGIIDTNHLSQKLSTLWGQLLQHCFVNSVISSAHIVVKKHS